MPSYLVHGFRWPRSAIRCHVIYNNIDDAAPEYIISPKTSAALLESFHELYPDVMKQLPELHFVEQYDPEDQSHRATSQPYAFVADKVRECRLSLNVSTTMGQGVSKETWEAIVDLKDRLAPEEHIQWFMVHNGDESRPKFCNCDLVSQRRKPLRGTYNSPE